MNESRSGGEYTVEGLQGKAVAVRNANWNHHHDSRCFNVNLNVHAGDSKLHDWAIAAKACGGNSDRSFPLTVRGMPGLMLMTKTHGNIFPEICSAGNLLFAFRRARKGKSKRQYVTEFESNLEAELAALKSELETGAYQPRPMNRFVVRDPKTRVIHAPAFRDRVVHQAIFNVLEPIFERSFIHDSYASRKGKGTHAALFRFDAFKMKASANAKPVPFTVNNNMVRGGC